MTELVPTPLPTAAPSLPDAGPVVEALIRRGDSEHTRRAYAGDLRTYAGWLASEGLDWLLVKPDDLERYREWLATAFARTTANRRLSVVRGLYAEAERRGAVASPAGRLRGLRGRDEHDGGALSREEARRVLDAIVASSELPGRHLLALRDVAIVSLLIRTGLRRSEIAGLRVGSIGSAQGHHILTIRGKGNVTRTAKLPPDVWRLLGEWLEARAVQAHVGEDDPLFVAIRKGGQIDRAEPLSDRAIHAIVAQRLGAANVARLGPHALRATFVTLALEGGAPLHLVQHAAGHADPRTTERYWRRKASLDDNAVDYVEL